VSPDDPLEALPLTAKAELGDEYPFGTLAAGLRDTVRIHGSSGTRGKPTIVAYTAADVRLFADVNARAIACAGGTADDVLHVAYGYGLFTGGLGLHYGGERLGATVVPASGGNPAFQVQLLADLGATGLACTPSFALLLAERAAADGVLDRIRLRFGLHGAEPWSEGLRTKLEAAWGGYDACDIYGLSEVIGPGVAAECREGKGALHVFDDHFLPEILDPESGRPAADGALGELVLTTLTKEALPVLRYRTGDVTRFVGDECACGRTHPRIAPSRGGWTTCSSCAA
jgi:phenylacetate-CoA ligase